MKWFHRTFSLSMQLSCKNSCRRVSNDAKRPVFNRRTKKEQKRRAAISPDVHVYDYLKDEVAKMLCDRVCDVKRQFPVALDLGSGRGYLSRLLSQQHFEDLKLQVNLKAAISVISIVFPQDGIDVMLQADMCQENLHGRFVSPLPCDPVVLDEENLPFQDNSFDLVLSSMSLHWVNDLPKCFKEILRVLKSDGCFLGVMCGADTLFELRCALQLAETEREGGIAPHVSPMIQGHQLANLLSGAGFNLVTLDFDQLIVNFPSIFELMEDLQGMGENNAVDHCKMLHRDTLLAAAAIYQAMYGNAEEGSVPATFQLLFMIGWKPHDSQQQPLDRGAVPKGFNLKKDGT